MLDFLRVFEIPTSESYGKHARCFSGGYLYPVKLVDWFDGQPPEWMLKEPLTIQTKSEMISEDVAKKVYIKRGFHYVCVCDSGLIVPVYPGGVDQ